MASSPCDADERRERVFVAVHDLASFADEVTRLATVINAPARLLPTYGRTEDFARPHIEFDGSLFHFVVVERGQELERISSPEPREILFHVFEMVTFSMAGQYELHHRRLNEDSRRQMFAVQLDLLGQLAPDWQQRTRARLDEVLRKHPFVD